MLTGEQFTGTFAGKGLVSYYPIVNVVRYTCACVCKWVPVFLNRTLSTDTKRTVYKAVVGSILLYGAETWTVKAPDVRRLNSFHNRCVRTILGVTRFQQW